MRQRFADALRAGHVRFWRSLGRAGGEPRRRHAAVVLKLDRLGDFVLALGAIRLVLEKFGEERCALVIGPDVAALARQEFPRATLVVLPPLVRHKRAWPGWWRARAELSALACDHLVCLRHQRWDYHELALGWIRAGHVHAIDDPRAEAWVAQRRSGRHPARQPWREGPVAAGLCRELELHRQVLAEVWGEFPAPDLIRPRLRGVPLIPGGAGGRYAVVAPLASDPLRRIPPGLVAQLTQAGAWPEVERLLVVGSAEQEHRLQQYVQELGGRPGVMAAVMMPGSVPEFAALVAEATWVLTADTAAAHLGAALDRPTVVLLGGGHPGQFGPWSRSGRQRWLTHPLPCFGCAWKCPHPEPWCLTRISAAEVSAALADVVAAPADPRQAGGLTAR